MSPPTAENDPVHKGLHELGQQVDQGAPPPDPADNPVERGLHELGRQIDEAERRRAGRVGPGPSRARGRGRGRTPPPARAVRGAGR